MIQGSKYSGRKSGCNVNPASFISCLASCILLLIWSVGAMASPLSDSGTTYYLDSSGGNDEHKGTSAEAPWKSLAKLAGIEFHPGDRILLKADCRFVGQIHPKRSWGFFEATRTKKDSWLFANKPAGKVHHVDDGAYVSPIYPLAYYGELRALGFIPPWLDESDPALRTREDGILRQWADELETVGLNREADWTIRNRVFMNETPWPKPRSGKAFLKSLSPGGVEPELATREKTLEYFSSLPWEKNPYSACGRIGHALDLYMAQQREAGEEAEDDSYHYVKALVAKQFHPEKGTWGGPDAGFVNQTSGNMKILCTYARFDWRNGKIERKKVIYQRKGFPFNG